jgi:hypothetical protein
MEHSGTAHRTGPIEVPIQARPTWRASFVASFGTARVRHVARLGSSRARLFTAAPAGAAWIARCYPRNALTRRVSALRRSQ